MKNEMHTTRYEIYVAFNDGETGEQKYEDGRYIDIIKNVCKGYGVAYSLGRVKGGYITNAGELIEDNSVNLILLGITDEQAEEIAGDLCAFFNQESVLIVKSPVTYTFLSKKIW